MPEDGRGQVNYAIAGLLAQFGCVTLLFVGAALGICLWLDTQFNIRPVFTLLLVLGSVPITIFLMVRIVLTGMARIQGRAGSGGQEQPGERDED